MMRSRDLWLPPQHKENLRFVGARTWSQFLLETHDRRIMITPDDWLLLTAEGWQKLSSQGEINDYLNRKLIGELFVIDGLEKKNGKQFLTGHLFNSSRSEMQKLEIPLNQSEKPSLAALNASAVIPNFTPPSPEQSETNVEDAPNPLQHLIRGVAEEIND